MGSQTAANKNVPSGTPSAATSSASIAPRFRQRKISLKQLLKVLFEKNLPNHIEDVRGDLLGIIETGVDKSEEDERHLQAVLNSTSSGGKNSNTYIPTPKASTKWDEYSKYYTKGWTQTDSYLRSSATVEDAIGNDYCMDETDAEFLIEMNKNEKFSNDDNKCSEDDFELICSLMEKIVAEKQPFLVTMPDSLMCYDEMLNGMMNFLNEREEAMRKDPLNPDRLLRETVPTDYALKFESSGSRSTIECVKMFSKPIYEHWRSRKVASGGKSLFPSLHYETGMPSDDNDPYVCFRKREVRYSRKTRRTDQQNGGILRKLYVDIHKGYDLMASVLEREETRLDHMECNHSLFQARCKYKELKRKLNLGSDPEDVQLLVSVPKRVRQEEQARLRRQERDRERREKALAEKQRIEKEKREAKQHEAKLAEKKASAAASATVAGVTAPGVKLPELYHLTVEQQMRDIERNLQEAIHTKMLERKKADQGWVNAIDSIGIPTINYYQNTDLHTTPNENTDLLRFSSIENNNSRRAADLINSARLDLASQPDDIDVISTDSKGNARTFSAVDFTWDKERYTAPRNGKQAIARLLQYGTQYLDRIIPYSQNPMTEFGKKLREAPQSEADERLADRYKYSHAEDPELDLDAWVFDDPAKLNGVKPETQNIRFGSVLTSKANELLVDAHNQRRKAIQSMAKRQQMQSLQVLQQQQAKKQNQLRAQAAANKARVASKTPGKVKKMNDSPSGKGVAGGKNGQPKPPVSSEAPPRQPPSVNGRAIPNGQPSPSTANPQPSERKDGMGLAPNMAQHSNKADSPNQLSNNSQTQNNGKPSMNGSALTPNMQKIQAGG